MLKIRLRRMGAIRQPHYRIVVADARAPRDGRFLEILGHYNPRTNPATIQVDVTKYEEWKRKGAQPTGAVERLVRQYNRTAQVEAAPAVDQRTRAASGKRVSPPASAAAPAAEVATTDTPMNEAVAEAARDEGEGSEALTGASADTADVTEAPAETPEDTAEDETAS
jgi:small subunit ribosomal protein S16